MTNNFKELIKEICIELDIKYKFLSKDWVIMLEKDEKNKFISGYKFDLNTHGMGLIADDKYALYEVLKSKNIPVTEHKLVLEVNSGVMLENYARLNPHEYTTVKNIYKNAIINLFKD